MIELTARGSWPDGPYSKLNRTDQPPLALRSLIGSHRSGLQEQLGRPRATHSSTALGK